MTETDQPKSPEAEAREQYNQYVVRSYDAVGHLAEVALNMSAWAPHVDWAARLESEGVTNNGRIIEAFGRVKRFDFLPPEVKPRTPENRPLPIGNNQTNLQPSTVAMMLDWLDPQPGQKILDIGVGSGWTTALLSELVSEKGSVHGTERILELVRSAKSNLSQYDYPQATVHYTPRRLGLRSEAPYDRILVSAAIQGHRISELFRRQLSTDGGIIVAPMSSDESHGNDKHDKEVVAIQNDGGDIRWLNRQEGYAFVPLVLPESGKNDSTASNEVH